MAEHIDFDTIIAEPIIQAISTIPPPHINSLKQFIAHKYPVYCDLFKHARFPQQGSLIANVITSKTAISVTDASFSSLTQKAAVS